MRFLIAISFVFLLHQNVPARSQESTASEPSSPAELIQGAAAMFPPELSEQIQEQILLDLQKRSRDSAAGRQTESFMTLFLADLFYNDLGVGRFHGAPTVTWNGYDPNNGLPIFYYDTPGFSFVTSTGRKISPGAMDTDGGSIPKLLHSVGDFTPWGYGPGYIVHDWIFVAHKCNFSPDNDIDFETSALILAEAMKTLMVNGFTNVDGEVQKFPKNEDSLYLIYQAVRSNIARQIWNATDSVMCR